MATVGAKFQYTLISEFAAVNKACRKKDFPKVGIKAIA